MARRYTIQCSVSTTQTRCTLSWTREVGRQEGRVAGKERGRKEDGREGAWEQGRVGRREGTI